MNKAFWITIFLTTGVLAVIWAVPRPVLTNLAYLQAMTAYTSSDLSETSRLSMMRAALDNACAAWPTTACATRNELVDANVLQAFDNYYLHQPGSLQLVIGSRQVLKATDMRASGTSTRNNAPGVIDPEFMTLWGNGNLDARLFMLDKSTWWTISVEAQHDSPPPVILQVLLDDQFIGDLIFDRGDSSWGYLSTDPVSIRPGLHWLHVLYVNDYFEPKAGRDRNASIRQVVLTRQ